MKRILSSFANLICLALISVLACSCNPKHPNRSIVILFENDVHCAIDGYPQMAAYRDQLSDTASVQMVSCGDFIQGGVVGSLSKGQAIIDIMKTMQYDVITIGNHEFDYKCPHLFSLMKELSVPVTCCNFIDYKTRQSVYPSYVISEVGGRKIAYVGVTTPTTLSTMPSAFVDEEGQRIYDLAKDEVFDCVQTAVDQARKAGAEYVFVLSHLGEEENDMGITSQAMVAATNGIDVVLDAHAHNVIPQAMVANKDGKEVPVSQTGTKFSHVGKLVILPNGKISISLIETETLTARNETVQAAVEKVKAETEAVTARLICHSDVALPLEDEDGFEFGRICESAAGDLATDAFRTIVGSDICVLDAGSIRNGLKSGNLTYGDIIAFLPYDSQLCEVDVTGEELVQMLMANTILIPNPDGQFPMVSGMRYTVDAITHVVSNVEVLDKTTGTFLPIEKEKSYTVASTEYTIFGGGLRSSLANARPLRMEIAQYCDAFVDYVSNSLNSHITEHNCHLDGRIKVKNLELALKNK